MKKFFVITALSAIAISAFAVDSNLVEKSIPLANGSTVYIFKDGKMAMENKFGRAERMKQNEAMETKDGQKIMMHGDEVSTLTQIHRIKK